MRSHPKIKTFAFTALMSAMISGCSSYTAKIEDNVEYRKQSSLSMLEKSQTVKKHSLFNELDGVYLGRLNYGESAEVKPSQLSSIIYYNEQTPMALEVAVNKVSYDTGINIYFTESALEFLSLDTLDEEDEAEGGDSAPKSSVMNNDLEAQVELSENLRLAFESMSELKKKNEEAINVSEETIQKSSLRDSIILKADDITLEDWLNDFTLERGLYWDYGTISGKPYVEITATMTETIQFEGLMNLASESDVQLSAAKAWEEVKAFADKIKSNVGKVSTSDATGRIYIKDRPAIIKELKNRVDYENDVFNQMIYYDLRVLTFRQSENENIQLNWEGIYEDLRSTVGLSSPGTEGSGFSASFLTSSSSSNFAGSNATVNALKTLLKGAREASASGRARNRSTFTSSPNLNAKIVSGTEVTATENGTVVTDVTSDVKTGISFNLFGSILSGGKVAIDMSLLYEDEISRETRSSDNGDISLPTTYNVPIAPQFVLSPGETAIFATSTSNISSNKTGLHEDIGWLNILFGGNNQTTSENTLTLIIVEAKIVGR